MDSFGEQLIAANDDLAESSCALRKGLNKLSFETAVVSHNCRVLKDECRRVRDICANAKQIVREIDDEFTRLTGLDSTDFAFLSVATALQTARWIIIDCLSSFGEGASRDDRVDHDDRTIKADERSSIDEAIDGLNDPQGQRYRSDVIRGRTWSQILSESVPFDVIDGSAQFGLGMNGANHREMTLGHDPILGWFFGTINILTDTTTVKNGRTFIMSRTPKLQFSFETTFTNALRCAYMSCREDKKRLAAAIAMEAIHLKSDFFSKAGLPIPIIPAVLPDLSSALYKENYDALCLAKDVGIVATQATMAIFINCVIAQLHGYFYDAEKFVSREIYEVKTRKILLYSNVIAETSNVLSVAARLFMGDGMAWKHLDFGGLGVLVWRIITDVDFMFRIREEFVSNRLREMVVGDYKRRLWPMKEV